MTSPADQEIDECLKDKCSTANNDNTGQNEAIPSFQSLPDFAETVAFVHQFGTLFELSPFSFDDLAQALHQLHPPAHEKYCPPNSLLDNLFAEILHYCGYKFDRSSLYVSLYKLIRRVNRWTPVPYEANLLYKKHSGKMAADNDDDEKMGQRRLNGIGEGDEEAAEGQSWHQTDEADLAETSKHNNTLHTENKNGGEPKRTTEAEGPALSNLSAAHVLRLVAHLLDYLLQCVHEDGVLDPKFSDEQLHPTPLCVDSAGRKFWYFANDTWLFMEQGRPAWLDEETELMRRRRRSQQRNNESKKEAPSTPTPKRRKEKKRHIRTIYDKKKRRKSDGTKQKRKNGEEGEEQKEAEEGTRKREAEEEEEQEAQTNITSQEVDRACANLFTGTLLRPVCTCSDHFVALINAYRNQGGHQQNTLDGDKGVTVAAEASPHTVVVEKLEQCLHKVRTIEQERRRKAAERERERWASAMRMSSRVVALMERRRVEEEQAKARKEKILAEKRRIAEEHLALLREHRCLTGSEIRQNMSREERHRLRQQRVEEQRERDQLIEAGVLLDNTDDNDDGTNDDATTEENGANEEETEYDEYNTEEDNEEEEEEDDDESWDDDDDSGGRQNGNGQQQRRRRRSSTGQQHTGKRRRPNQQRLLPVSRPIRVRKVRQQHCRFWRWAPEAPVPSKIANFSHLPPPSSPHGSVPSLSPCCSSSSASVRRSSPASAAAATAPAVASSFCLLMGERQLPAAVKRKMSSFFAECSPMAASTGGTASPATAAAALLTAAPTPMAVNTKTSAIHSIRSVLQLPGVKW